jgi:antitoxin component YwqK of YwqJK toxin-antitoxin module
MNVIKSFFDWIMGWVMTGVILLAVGFIIMTVSGKTGGSDSNTTSSHETKISKDEKLIEVRKEYWENGNLKSEVPYKKSYGLGWKKVKTKLKPHGIAKDYYESGTLKKEDPYIDGERTGTMKIYDEEGQLKASIEYKNSKQDGLETWYYSDGTVMDEVYYKDGNKTEVKDS